MKKRVTGAAVILIILLLVLLCCSRRPYPVISRFVQTHEEELEQLAEEALAERRTDYQYRNIDHIQVIPGTDTDIVQFYYPRLTLLGTMEYYGFYYSADGVPVSDQNTGFRLTEETEGAWSWEAPGKEGNGKTSLITGNWYYFESSY